MKLIYHPLFLKHQVNGNCPETPERLSAAVEEIPFLQEGLERLSNGEPEEIVVLAENGEQYLKLFHDERYIKQIKDICHTLQNEEIASVRETENCFSHDTYQAACYAVGAAVQAAELAKHGQKAFALVRPPGHHAHADHESGFCVFNNMAIAAEYLRQRGERVMIVDADLHLGDGTLEYAEGREGIFYFSINQKDIWPGIVPPPTNNTQNIFLPEGTTDDVYIKTLEEKLVPALKSFNPTIVAVSAGFDTMGTDYGELNERVGFALTNRSYYRLWEILDEQLVPYFMVLEGGYNPLSILYGVLSFFNKENQE